ncbi:odorant receptor 131-2-like [Clupea harengus]|uniref:Odorant receptor 131-2-like n=1 Tax=Clupea harengus TaxID=7950 RepID=A0A6P8FYK6_CLUHA|nr:odorant receptor 131-2-like [Clupea harengus]
MALNESGQEDVLIAHQQMFQVQLTAEGPLTKLLVAVFMSALFISINSIMFVTLRSKAVFRDTPRYVLFAHMLCNDSIQLLFSSLMYIISLCYVQVAKAVCSILILVTASTSRNAPINLAVMSLERYVAICFPLRHGEIATKRRTGAAISVIWFFGAVNPVIDILYTSSTDPTFFSERMFCTRERIFTAPWQRELFEGLNAFYFVAVTLIIVFTYISVMVAARSASSNKESAKKAHRTLLLHLIQLGLCLNTLVFGSIERLLAMTSSSRLFMDLRYVNFLLVLILPRCLSPLIYGLRDDTVRPLFLFYLQCSTHRVKPNVNMH